jgi:hypothetical protein
VLSLQTSPVAAPQIGQRTDTICFGVSSVVFMIHDASFPDARMRRTSLASVTSITKVDVPQVG